ncbi:MAG: winged helix-turn-helix transcriptional regulator [Asgard group archaeon]|nr:winged helix-turn-helix transcriptional regulator [Asgard group archaeon]
MMELDKKDLAIVEILDSSWPKISTSELSKRLGIPSRTIRYRLARLKEMGILKQLRVVTHERKLGLGKKFIILDNVPKQEESLKNILKQIPYINCFSSTYGRYNGFYVELLYALENPTVSSDLLDALKKEGFILDSYVLEQVDYKIKGIDFNQYDNVSKSFQFDWDKWYQNINVTYTKSESFDFTFEQTTKLKDFDFIDILILNNLKEDITISLKELKQRINLSEVQISRRIQQLEDKDIILGYKFVLAPQKSKDLIYLICFIETFEPLNQVLACIYQLPFLIEIFIESITKFCLLFRMSINEYKNLLKGIDLLRPYFKHYSIQTIHSLTRSNFESVYDFYDKKTHSWNTPILDYLKIIKKG